MDRGEIVLGRFAIEAQVASGAMGIIHRGRDTTTGQTVAVKVLRGGTKAGRVRFRREASVLASLDPPGIVRYVAHGETDAGDPAIVMEWVEGKDLSRESRLPVDSILDVI